MQFLEAIETCVVKKYCDFEGRASRSEFWWYTLGYVIVSYAWSFIMGLITGASVMAGMDGNFQFSAIQLLSYIPAFALLLPTLGVGARRLHDIGKSGWWQLLYLICCGGLVLLYFFVQDSEGDNQYGPRPQN
jgi:uncharacterized membrane protein YhaH (DUF805 family)